MHKQVVKVEVALRRGVSKKEIVICKTEREKGPGAIKDGVDGISPRPSAQDARKKSHNFATHSGSLS
jgi:hypothetical protein